jgi:1-acyl-sn-glycerol-3-phosphate acyltransferase
MWWNYRKPRPLKNGAFNLAVSSNVPVIPVFITMKDSDVLDGDGFPVQKYIINFLKPIYPDSKLSKKENIETMKNKNFEVWKKTYEDFYNTKLTYEK